MKSRRIFMREIDDLSVEEEVISHIDEYLDQVEKEVMAIRELLGDPESDDIEEAYNRIDDLEGALF